MDNNVLEEFYGPSMESVIAGSEGILDNKLVRYGIAAGATYIGFKVLKHFANKKIKKLQAEADARFKANMDKATVFLNSKEEVKEWITKLKKVINEINKDKTLMKKNELMEIFGKITDSKVTGTPKLAIDNESILEMNIFDSKTDKVEGRTSVIIPIWGEFYNPLDRFMTEGTDNDLYAVLERNSDGTYKCLTFINSYTGAMVSYPIVKDLVGKYGKIGELFQKLTAFDMIDNSNNDQRRAQLFYEWMEDMGYDCWGVNENIKRAFFSKMGMSYDDNIKIKEDYSGEIQIPVHYNGSDINE